MTKLPSVISRHTRQPWRNPKHRQQWRNTLITYANPIIGKLDVGAIDTPHILDIPEPIWREKTETASRLRGRLETVLDWCKVRQYRNGENPARWRGHLAHLLPARSKIAAAEHHASLPYPEMPVFIASCATATRSPRERWSSAS